MHRSSFLVLLCFTAASFAQLPEQIAGVVVDPDHAAVPDATVRLLGPNGAEAARTLTDRQGRFSFSRLCGDCSLEIQLVGFKTTHVAASPESRVIQLQVAPVEENVVVTPNRTEMPTTFVGSTTTVITRNDIEARQAPVVGDLLQSVPGVIINRSGGYGAVTSIFTRGGDSDYTKILLDGIPLNQPGGLFDLATLQSTNVDRIEVVRGPQSALFGSDAMTGIVQLFSRHGDLENRRPQITLNADGGNFETVNAGADLNGSTGRFDYDTFWSRFSTNNQGINADFEDSTVGTNLGLNLGKTHLRWILRDDLSHVGNPGQTAFGPAVDDSFAHRGDGYTGLSIENEITKTWHQRLTYTFDRTRYVSRDFGRDAPFLPTFDGRNAIFEFSDFASNFLNDVRRHAIDYQSGLTFGSGTAEWGQHTFTLAVSGDKEVGSIGDRLAGPSAITHQGLHDVGGVFQYQAIIGRWSLTNGFRVEDHSLFGRTVTPRTSLAYLLRRGSGGVGATKLKFNFGLGFKEPNLVELFSPDMFFLGDRHLRPERDRSFDFGLEQRLWNDRAKVEINWFDNRFRDLVAFEITNFNTFAGSYFNVNAAKADGAEVFLETVPIRGLALTGSYTYLNTQITRSATPLDPVFGLGKGLLRRARHSGSLGASWQWRKLTASATALYVGRRVDDDFAGFEPPFTSDPSYSRLDLAWAYHFTQRFSYVGAITNALDRHYMEALGYPALTTTFRTGGRFIF